MTVKKSEFPSLTVIPDVLRFLIPRLGRTPISSATDASCASVSATVPSCSTDASICSPCLVGGGWSVSIGVLGFVGLDVGVPSPGVDGSEVPRS